jgi:putative N6-adenine-specific DNA methylase
VVGRATARTCRRASRGGALSRRAAVAAQTPVAAFAIAAPGLEPIVALELERLGITGAVEAGGVAWNGSMDSVARANLWLRTASRVLVRLGEFRARTFWELERHARKLPWERFAAPGTPVRFRVTSRKSRLYHTDAIAQRLAEAVAARAGTTAGDSTRDRDPSAGTPDDEDGYDDDHASGQLFVVRVVRDICTVSADASGALLYRRGYRQAVAKAPLRETIAAAMLLGSEWPGSVPLIDPLCGSGTIPIEAALIARRIAPGLGREFALQKWPDFDASRWERMVAAARENQLSRASAPILGSDRDAGAVESAGANAARAGVAGDIDLQVRPISAAEPPSGRGWVVTNPPYGVRVGEAGAVRDLYAALGNVLRARFRGWTVALLSPAATLERQLGVALGERFATVNGGIPVRLMTGQVAG